MDRLLRLSGLIVAYWQSLAVVASVGECDTSSQLGWVLVHTIIQSYAEGP